MAASTRFICRLMGIYSVIAAVVMASHRESMVGAVTLLVHDAALMFFVGILTVLGGLAWILAHNPGPAAATPCSSPFSAG